MSDTQVLRGAISDSEEKDRRIAGQRHSTSHPIVRVIVRRLLFSIPLLLVVSALSFFLESLAPGNAAQALLGENNNPAAYAQLKHRLGLDLPIWDQYWRWLRGALHGDLGSSWLLGERVSTTIGQRLPVTLSLILVSLALTVIVGMAVGFFSAIRGGPSGRAVDALALLGFAVPGFWIGAELIVLFSVTLHWFPAEGFISISQSPTGWIHSLVLPVVALTLASVAGVAKQTRDAMLDALGSEYVRMSKASGLSPTAIYFRHALKNASVRVLTIIGIQAVALLSGTVFVESVFALPGLGSLVVTSALQHDLPVVQGVAVTFTVMVVLINLAVDVAYTFLNPKVNIQ